MKDMELINNFNEVREYLIDYMQPTVDNFVIDDLNPLERHLLLKGMKEMLYQELSAQFPSFPSEYFPQILMKVEDDGCLEIYVQKYLNKISCLKYLGSCEYDGVDYDMYHSDRWGVDPWVVSRYGHLDENYISGSTTARTEYDLGIMTPLAIAYSMAIDLGCIKL